MVAGDHAQPAAAEHPVDVGGRHRPLPEARRRRGTRGSQCGRALAKPMRCTSSTVASSVLPLAPRERDQVVAAARQRHRLGQHPPPLGRRRRACARRRCTARAARREPRPRSATLAPVVAPLPTMRAGSSGEPPAGGVLVELAEGVVAGQQLEAQLAAAREAVGAAVADPGDQPLRREHVDRRAQRHRRRARRRRSRWAMRLAIARSAPSIARRTPAASSRAPSSAECRWATSCAARGLRPSPRRRRRRRRRTAASDGRAALCASSLRWCRLPHDDATAASIRPKAML